VAALSAAERRLAELETERTAALSADELDAAKQIDNRIAGQRGEIAIYRDRISLLKTRLAAEQRTYRQKEYAAAVDRSAAAMQPVLRTAAALEAALVAVAVTSRQFRDEAAAIRKCLPADLQPGHMYAVQAAFDTRHIGEILKYLQPHALVHPMTRRPASAEQFTERAMTLDKEARGFANEQKSRIDSLLAELRSGTAAEPEPIEDEAA
jgi:hypothetical protein